MSKIFKIVLLLLLSVTILNCSSDYDYSPDVNTKDLTFTTLQTNLDGRTVVGTAEVVEFQLKNDANDEELSEAATFYINDEEIDSNEYTFTEEGSYEIYATINQIESNKLTLKVVDGNYVSLSTQKAVRGQTVTFQSFDVNGNETTQESTFMVNNSPISGNEFSNEESGIYSVKATYQGNTSTPTDFEIFTPNRKVALEDYTGTWCGWCPRVLLLIEEVEDVTENIVPIAIHNEDKMVFSTEQEVNWREAFEIGISLPKLRANRTDNISVIQDSQIPSAVDYITSMAGSETNNAIAIDTKLSGDKLKVNVKLLSEEGLNSSHKLAVYLYQDGLIYDQHNYYNTVEGSRWFGEGDPIENFTHNHVLEASLTENLLGDNIESISAYQTWNRTLPTVDLSSYADTANGNTFDPKRFGVAVFLVDENNTAINAQSVKAGENVDFDE